MKSNSQVFSPLGDEQVEPTQGLGPDQRKKRVRLTTRADVAKEFRRLYGEARSGVLPLADAEKLAQLLSLLLNAVDDSASVNGPGRGRSRRNKRSSAEPQEGEKTL
jgi:hypothetical protein